MVPGADRHGVQLLHVLKALAPRFIVDVLTLRVGDLGYIERFHKTRMLRVPVPEGTLAQQVDAFRRALRRQLEGAEYDLVHFRDAWSGLPVIERRRQLGYRTVFDVGRSSRGEPRPVDVKLAAALARDEGICCERADLVLAPTEMGRRFLSAKGRPDRFVVVPPGVDIDRFDAEPADVGGKPCVLYAGALAPARGVRVLLRAFRDVAQRTPARLLLVGPVEAGFAEPLAGAIGQLGLTDHVELLGPIENEDMPRIIARATVCVAPAAADVVERPTACFPTKVLEFMACRRATVAPRRSSLAEVLQDGVDGLMFEPGRPRDLAEKLLRLLADTALRERLAETAQHRVRARFPAGATRRRLLEAYARILPPSSWLPVGEGAAPIPVPQTGRATGEVADITSDTNPAVSEEELAQPPAPATDPNAAADDTLQIPPVSDTEPWIVIAPDGSIARLRPEVARVVRADGDEGTPAEGTDAPSPPTPPAGIGFVAGELDVPTGPRREIELPAESIEAQITDEIFVAAGELLGRAVPPGDTKP